MLLGLRLRPSSFALQANLPRFAAFPTRNSLSVAIANLARGMGITRLRTPRLPFGLLVLLPELPTRDDCALAVLLAALRAESAGLVDLLFGVLCHLAPLARVLAPHRFVSCQARLEPNLFAEAVLVEEAPSPTELVATTEDQ